MAYENYHKKVKTTELYNEEIKGDIKKLSYDHEFSRYYVFDGDLPYTIYFEKYSKQSFYAYSVIGHCELKKVDISDPKIFEYTYSKEKKDEQDFHEYIKANNVYINSDFGFALYIPKEIKDVIVIKEEDKQVSILYKYRDNRQVIHSVFAAKRKKL